jgi:hypothetical protein
MRTEERRRQLFCDAGITLGILAVAAAVHVLRGKDGSE